MTSTAPTRPRSAVQGAARFTDTDIAEAKQKIREAFAHCGLISGGRYICPACMKVHKGKSTLSIRDIGTWKCFSSGEGGDAISLVQSNLGLAFPKAVALLLGRDTGEMEIKPIPRELPPVSVTRDTSTIDPEVYGEVIRFAGKRGVQAAEEYYGQWHISPEAVREAHAVRILDSHALENHMKSKFGIERLRECGLVVTTRKGKDYFLLNRDYPVVEPHISPKNEVLGMQFRASEEQSKKVAAHAQEGGSYVPKFLSLSGIDPEQSLIGTGLHTIWRQPEGSVVWVVEGFKDMLATMTMGFPAYGMPGTWAVLSERVINLLRRFDVRVAMDGDEAGIESRKRVVEELVEHGVRATPVNMPPDMDATDVLVSRFARSGHDCPACNKARQTM